MVKVERIGDEVTFRMNVAELADLMEALTSSGNTTYRCRQHTDSDLIRFIRASNAEACWEWANGLAPLRQYGIANNEFTIKGLEGFLNMPEQGKGAD